MKNILTCIALFFCMLLSGQENLFMYSYRDVPADEMDLFKRNEADFWSKVHSKLLKEKKITGWTMMSRVGGLASDPNIYFYIGIGSYENLDNAPANYSKAIEEVMGSLDAEAQKKMKERLKQHKFTRADVMLNRQAAVFAEGQDWNYLVHNYAKANNVGAFMDTQDKYFKPFFEEHIKAKNTKQVAWMTARVLNPVGNHYNWNCYTVDAFQKLSDIYNPMNTEVTWPEEGMTEVGKTMVDPGFYKSVIWHKEMWLDGEGNLRTAWD